MVNVIRDGILQFGSRFRVCLFQFGNSGTLFLIQFFSVKTFKNRFRSVILRKEVVAETTFTTLLQGRAIGTVSAQVILPCHVVQTFGIIAAAGNYIIRVGSTGLDSISGCAICFHRSRENHFLVIRHLIRYLLAIFTKHYDLSRISQLQLGCNVTHRNLNHFTCALQRQRIGYCNRH